MTDASEGVRKRVLRVREDAKATPLGREIVAWIGLLESNHYTERVALLDRVLASLSPTPGGDDGRSD